MNATETENRDDEYDDYIDEFSTVEIGSLTYSGSRVLKELDPIAYRCGYSDFTDAYPSWDCGECGETFDSEDKAEECCAEVET